MLQLCRFASDYPLATPSKRYSIKFGFGHRWNGNGNRWQTSGMGLSSLNRLNKGFEKQRYELTLSTKLSSRLRDSLNDSCDMCMRVSRRSGNS